MNVCVSSVHFFFFPSRLPSIAVVAHGRYLSMVYCMYCTVYTVYSGDSDSSQNTIILCASCGIDL